MEFNELLLKYLMGVSYTADTLTTAHRLRLLAQAEQMLVSYLVELEFVIETITDDDNSKKMFHLGYITGIVSNIIAEVKREIDIVNQEIHTGRAILRVKPVIEYGGSSK